MVKSDAEEAEEPAEGKRKKKSKSKPKKRTQTTIPSCNHGDAKLKMFGQLKTLTMGSPETVMGVRPTEASELGKLASHVISGK